MDIKELMGKSSNIIAALGHEVRRDIIVQLANSYPNGLRIGEITTKRCLTRPTLSHHLKVLVDCKFIKFQHDGTKNYYYLCPDQKELAVCIDLLKALGDFGVVTSD